MDCICLITAPRTGTNHLSEVLRNFSELAPFGEVFDLDGVQGVDAADWPVLRHETGIDFSALNDPRLVAFAHEKPGAWLDALEKAAAARGKRFMSFKLVRGNMSFDDIEQQIMPRRGLRLVMVVRKQIDAYVSWRKAIELGKWQGVDTTGMRLTLDPDKFEQWLDAQERWFDHWRNYLNRHFLPLPVVRYEIDIDIPTERALRRFISAAGIVGIALRPPATITHHGFERQDKAKLAADKVSNWAEFNREIFSRKLERRAFGYPI